MEGPVRARCPVCEWELTLMAAVPRIPAVHQRQGPGSCPERPSPSGPPSSDEETQVAGGVRSESKRLSIQTRDPNLRVSRSEALRLLPAVLCQGARAASGGGGGRRAEWV